jgi:hypothetical protein
MAASARPQAWATASRSTTTYRSRCADSLISASWMEPGATLPLADSKTFKRYVESEVTRVSSCA